MIDLSAIKSLIFIGAAYSFAAFVFKRAYGYQEVFRWLGFLLIPIATAAITRNIWFVYASLLFVGFKLIPKEVESRVFYYVLMLPVLPIMTYPVPFPGINYLLEMTTPRFVALVFLLPLYFQVRDEKNTFYHSMTAVDWMVALFCIITGVLSCRLDSSVTFWARLGVYNFIDIWLPYYVISRCARNLASPLIAIAFSASLMAVLAVVDWKLVWKSHTILASRMADVKLSWIFYINYFRGFGLRVSGSWLEPISFGAFMAMAVFANFMPSLWGHKRSMWNLFLLACSLLALLFTDSRAGVIMALVSVGAIAFYGSRSSGWKGFLIVVLTCGAIVFALKFDDFVQGDEKGTFQYRFNLLINSQDAIAANPLWGTPHFRSDPTLVETMTQGQGIVDIVNSYLRIVLEFGFAGLVPFLLAIALALSGYLAAAKRAMSVTEERKIIVSYLCIFVGLLFLIFTTSMIMLIPNYLWLLIAIGVAAGRYSGIEVTKKSGVLS